jgi:MoxR-like ATPase
MRHRVILNFEAQAEGIDTDHVLTEILKQVGEKADAAKPAPAPSPVAPAASAK